MVGPCSAWPGGCCSIQLNAGVPARWQPTVAITANPGFSTFHHFPDAILSAYVGLPAVLVWEAEKV